MRQGGTEKMSTYYHLVDFLLQFLQVGNLPSKQLLYSSSHSSSATTTTNNLTLEAAGRGVWD